MINSNTEKEKKDYFPESEINLNETVDTETGLGNLEKEKNVENLSEVEIKKELEELSRSDKKASDDDLNNNQAKQKEDEKVIQKLTELAKIKGALYAIDIAKKEYDDYVLDKLHDRLVEEGLR